jgi:hypothetical protein
MESENNSVGRSQAVNLKPEVNKPVTYRRKDDPVSRSIDVSLYPNNLSRFAPPNSTRNNAVNMSIDGIMQEQRRKYAGIPDMRVVSRQGRDN